MARILWRLPALSGWQKKKKLYVLDVTQQAVNPKSPVSAFLLFLAALSGGCAPATVERPQAAEATRQPQTEVKAGALVKADRPDWKIGYEWQYSWKGPSDS